MTHQDDVQELDLHIEAWKAERLAALLDENERKVKECEIRIAALEFYRERIAA